MGSSFSLFSNSAQSRSPETGLGDLPEGCVASVLVHLDPPQICRLAKLNRAFRGASTADFVWGSKLPPNYGDVVDRVFGNGDVPAKSLCKRDVYAALCTPNSIDGGAKKVWMDKTTGKICMLISSNGLAITGIDDRRYWSRIPTDESRFHSIAYLQQIWWFEVDGEIEFPFPAGSYSLLFRLHLGRSDRRFGRRICNTEHVNGWDRKPVRFQLSTSDGQQATKQCYLKEPGRWAHYHAGDFVVPSSCKSMKVKFSMTQIDCTHPKGGLCVDSVVIYPIEYRERLRR
ncbi:F-box protein PP2-A12-like [Andrographis paniculata]|uniref:F-box protein PP2-A12-like n=1 Tax=Andrographis paniculata TaxID=175694 RepID=UPI0021E6E5A3|nr:F-box protein PP2-A12-like [Andrographis paniculata]